MKQIWTILWILSSAPVAAQAAFTQCALEGDRCSFTGSRLVRYGEPWNDRWVQRVVTGGIDCTNAAFGSDPSPGTGKRCEMRNVPASSAGGPVRLAWDAPTQMVNGDPITETRRYRVHRRNPDGTFVAVLETGMLAADLSREPVGEQCYAVQTVLDPSQAESVLSNAACKVVRIPAPSDGAIERPTDGAIEPRR